jgi:hypothetical protein
MPWSMEETEEFTQWFASLTRKEQLKVVAATELLMEEGPRLGRPVVDTLKGAKYPNLKELRMTGTTLRAFSPSIRRARRSCYAAATRADRTNIGFTNG